MIDPIEIIWPRLRGASKADAVRQSVREASELKRLARQSWRKDTDVVLEEARRLTDSEAERRKTADTKAGTYLTVVGVLIPILSSLVPSLSDGKVSTALRMISAPLLILAVIYLVTAGIWAFKTLRVSSMHRIDTDDLVHIWSRSTPKASLVRDLLRTVYANRRPVNEKVSYIKMTDAFLLRAFITFAMLLIVQATWKPALDVYTKLHLAQRAFAMDYVIDWDKIVSVSASVAQILTTLGAIYVYLRYRWKGFEKRAKLEKYLESVKDSDSEQGARSINHLIVKIGLTEAEILQASFVSKHIIRLARTNENTGLAGDILLKYES